MPALEPTAASPPGDAWRVLPSGALACQLPPTKEGKPVWLDALLGVKLCEHGHSAGQIHHWRCAARPRAKPEWVTCTCTDAKGLCMDARVKPALPADVPAYHRVLWRDSEPVLLEAKGRWGVRVPGKPKGHGVFLAADGTPLCAHGFSASELRKRRTKQRVQAVSKLQAWWRAMTREARASVRDAMLGAVPPSRELRQAAAVWRLHSEWRRVASRHSNPWAKTRGRPPARVEASPCSCSTAGLRIDRFNAGQYGRNKKRPRHAPTLADVDPADTDRGADTDPAADTDHGDTDREAEPAERAEPTDAAERADAAEPAEPIEPIEPTDAIHAAEPIDHSAE